jgi:hypothetical protein
MRIEELGYKEGNSSEYRYERGDIIRADDNDN